MSLRHIADAIQVILAVSEMIMPAADHENDVNKPDDLVCEQSPLPDIFCHETTPGLRTLTMSD